MKVAYYCLIAIFCASCTTKEKEKTTVKPYFDVATYFKNEAKRMAIKNPPVDKMVSINGKSEQKRIAIKNWEKEFDTFISADINKASWRGLFKIDSAENVKTYTSNNEKIPVKELKVVEKNGKVISIQIFAHNINAIYVSQDSLSYFPDSLYRIKKTQKIKLMEEKRYEVVGKLGVKQ